MILNRNSQILCMKRFRQNKRLINNPFIRMFAILIDLVRVFDSCFDNSFAFFHFWVFWYNMVFPSILFTDNDDTIPILTPESLHATLSLGILAHYPPIVKRRRTQSSSVSPLSPSSLPFLIKCYQASVDVTKMLLGCTYYYQSRLWRTICQSPISTIVLT